MTEPSFDPEKIASILDAHGVEYVVVGGFAAQAYGATRPTRDVDVVPRTTTENLRRLVAALKELGAGIRVDDLPDGVPFDTVRRRRGGRRCSTCARGTAIWT